MVNAVGDLVTVSNRRVPTCSGAAGRGRRQLRGGHRTAVRVGRSPSAARDDPPNSPSPVGTPPSPPRSRSRNCAPSSTASSPAVSASVPPLFAGVEAELTAPAALGEADARGILAPLLAMPDVRAVTERWWWTPTAGTSPRRRRTTPSGTVRSPTTSCPTTPSPPSWTWSADSRRRSPPTAMAARPCSVGWAGR